VHLVVHGCMQLYMAKTCLYIYMYTVEQCTQLHEHGYDMLVHIVHEHGYDMAVQGGT